MQDDCIYTYGVTIPATTLFAKLNYHSVPTNVITGYLNDFSLFPICYGYFCL